ncbi:Fic family protein [Algoriphagus sp. D3-2-R+10]|uniref:Fic family protein n=1 Tax=Algoriphagus aurantiacus TaxID=3103948 RepID=UPI002B3AD538|nr:Fic family protein [Algoriphagus sp. D3-2-R+10]MEB2774757.1 Fic family protein [Algoriphagus sp. D3-2-R+10]
MKKNHQLVLDFIQESKQVSRAQIVNNSGIKVSESTFKRLVADLVKEDWIIPIGKGKATTYSPSPKLEILFPLKLDLYFLKEQDERRIKGRFDFEVFDNLSRTALFTDEEQNRLSNLHSKFKNKTLELTSLEIQKEMERLAIDLSWKSSQIEGNTYSLLETEQLLKEKKTAEGKTKDEAVMLLNHKEAIDFLVEQPEYGATLSLKLIEELHSLLVKELGINRNIRRRRVGITGTNYNPLDNEFEIREALEKTCNLVNTKTSIYEKAFLCLILISYIQPFADGNKRTSRILSNGILIGENYCPLSFRTVDPLDYKKAMLVFYEQTNITAMKSLFIEQAEFAVNTYF